MFFVIDFETSALDPWSGEPLTLGIVPVTQFGDIADESYHFYAEWDTVHIMPDWHLPANLTSTEAWWNEKRNSNNELEHIAWATAWLRDSEILSDEQILNEIDIYVATIEPNKDERFLCANPAAFDVMWMNYIFSMYGRSHPFHYRNLCLRSMRYGLEYGFSPEFGNARDEHELDGYIPHHALWDARMEALDLVELMRLGRNNAHNQNNLIAVYSELDRRSIKLELDSGSTGENQPDPDLYQG